MARRVRRSAGCCWLAGVGFTVGLAAIVSYVLRPEPGLLDSATHLANATSWVPGFGGYFWESDHSVLTFRKRVNGVEVVSVDVGTGAETARAALSNEIAAGGSDVVQWRVSRDGRYLLWHNDNGTTRTWHVSDLNGIRVKSWRSSSDAYGPMWLADGRRWVESHSGPGLPGRANQFQMACTVRSLTGPDHECEPIPGPFEWPVGVTPADRMIALRASPMNKAPGAGAVQWFAYSLAAKPRLVEQHAVRLSKAGSGYFEAELSPQGDRIAVFAHYAYLSPLEQLFQRFLPSWIEPHEKTGLWVIRADGRGIRLVGTEDGSGPFGLLWTLDGKRLSFVDHGTLFSVNPGTL